MLSQQTAATQPAFPDRRNACPGLSRMVMARDGAIARVKLALGRLTAAQARALADIAENFGNGSAELSIRSNVQLRAIQPANWPQAIAALYQAGLGAENPAADDIRNVMASPTAGIDTARTCDVTPLAESLLALLLETETLYALSPKFSLQIDGGEACAMISHPGDIWLSAMDGGTHYAFGLASSPDAPALGAIPPQQALPFIRAVLDLFLRHAQGGVARMKQLFKTMPQARFLDELAQALPFAIEPATGWRRRKPQSFAWLGQHPQSDGRAYVGAMPLLGRLDAAQLRALADLAEQANGGEIRLTPWQGVLLPHVEAAQARRVLQGLRDLGLATQAEAPAARLRVCSGSTGCASALADTLADGRLLARHIGDGASPVHLTGCAKSCAALAPLPHTLLARSPGFYDLFLQDKAGPSRFGRLLASNITIDEAARLLGRETNKSGPHD